ncbi:MAG: YfiR family protein [Proteobacteria bacterium]|nr:YfiR family protein [Pseudomonadota bacterium]MBU4470509.1 YfiR family protein [Pseudomonadota bacterium]MCG2751345.1 YfiR family protein [Desulfobacteraceae bacterium]
MGVLKVAMEKTAKIVFIFLFILGASGFIHSVKATEDSREYAVKAAFIYNFAKFVSWPEESKTEPFIIGVLGEDPFGDIWNEIRSKTVRGRPITVKQCGDDLDLASQCHVLFIDHLDREKLKKAINQFQGKPVLTIGDFPLFAETGGMIAFYDSENKIRFAINLESCRKAGLVVSSNLLKLAKIVE